MRIRTISLSLLSTAAFVAAPVAAQEARGSGQLDEIIVTAQKREESLQSTPISIAVLGSEDLEKRGVASLGDFGSGAVPSSAARSSVGLTEW